MTKEKSTVPRLRFPGFTDTWKQRKLGEYFVERLECSAEGELLSVTISDGVRRFSELGRKDNSSEDKTKYKVLKQGDIVYNSMRMWQGASGYSIYDGIVSPAYTVLIPTYLSYALFFSYLFKRSSSLQIFQVNSQGLTSDTWNLKYKPFSNIVFPAPTLPEQEAIGSFFSDLDQLITLHQRKLDDVKELKKALLQKMFPKGNGNDFPELRFPEFTDAWKQRKFSDLAEVRRGLTYSPSAIRSHGVRVLRSSNINEDTFVFGEDDVFVDKSVVKIPLVEEGDILITSANGSSRLVGKHSIIKGLPSNSAIHGGFMLLASSKVPCFLNAFMSSTWYHKFIGLYVAGGNGAIGNLNKSDLDEQIVLVPTLPEQEAIGSFFSDLDQLITLHQRQLDHLKLLKKALLQQMFI
ncbi:restriction endonuclease subunit S [Streptococcus suis]|uniref:restriction endonuclease subunit S n=1 Tax=Streptococcus suis TaxID=1307 RepID=UPI0003F4F8A6|nr:restriction endonuclease subunit S [Streptococcus suis]